MSDRKTIQVFSDDWDAIHRTLEGKQETIMKLRAEIAQLKAAYEIQVRKTDAAEAEIERLTMALEMFMRDEKTAAQNVRMLRADNERLRAALSSIARNTCCDRCQEGALVARRALAGERELEPHAYVPSAMHMGDCAVCGHLQGAAIHSPFRR